MREIQKHRGKPVLFHDKCPGFFYTAHGTYRFTSHRKDGAIMVKCLAQGHKRRDRLGRDSNPTEYIFKYMLKLSQVDWKKIKHSRVTNITDVVPCY